MFTIKVLKRRTIMSDEVDPSGERTYEHRFDTKILEAKEVEIYELRTNMLYEVAGTNADGVSFAEYIARLDEPRPDLLADSIELGYRAYIENSAGKTTEVVGW